MAVFSDDFNISLYSASLGELQSVGLQPQQHLHNPVFIAADHRALLPLLLIADIDESGVELYILIFSFLPLDAHHFLNGVFDVEHKVVLSELVSFNLSEVKQVLDNEVHQLGGVLLDLFALCKLIQDPQAVFEVVRLLKGLIHWFQFDL